MASSTEGIKKAYWRPGGTGEKCHLFFKHFKYHPMGIRFSSLCMQEWTSTIWYDKPKPYPPPVEKQCAECLALLPKGCKT